MTFSTRIAGLAILVAAGSFSSAPVLAAAEYVSIVQDVSVNAPAEAVWKKIGSFCEISTSMKLSCAYTSGTGDLGTVRRIADRIDEVMVAKTPLSYTYTQPTTTILYHGTLAVQPDGPKKSKIVYTLFYDQAPLATPEAKAADRTQRANRFAAALQIMKTQGEAK